MRTISSGILTLFLGLASMQCQSGPSTTPISTAKYQASVEDSSSKESSVGSQQESNYMENHVVTTSGPDPNVPYQDVRLMDVEQQMASYTAVIPVQKTPSGKLSLQVELNPQKHSIKKLTLLYARENQLHAIKQIGNGVGYYDSTNKRYYVNVAYQEILELSDKLRYSGDLQEINCWVSTYNNTAAINYAKPPKL